MAKTNKAAEQKTPSQPSLLAGLKVAEGTTKKDPKKDKVVVVIAGVEEYAALSLTHNEAHDGHMKGHKIKKTLMDAAFETGHRQGHGKNLNFDAVEGVATASMQLRIKDSQQKLDPEVVAQLHANGIRTFRHVIVPGALIINPTYRNDTELLEKILQVMADAGYDTAEIFQIQNENAYDIVCADTLDDIFSPAKALTPEKRREFFEQVAIPVVVPKYTGPLADAVAMATKVILPQGAKTVRKETTTVTVKTTTNGHARGGTPDFHTALAASLALENVKAKRSGLPSNAQGAFAMPAVVSKKASRRRGMR